MPDQGSVRTRRRRAPVDAPLPNASPAVPAVASQRCDEMLAILEQLDFPTRTNTTAKRFAGHYTLGDTRGVPGFHGFAHGLNHDIVSKCYPIAQRALLFELWDLLKKEGGALGYEFTTVQVNRNFRPGWGERHDHLGKDTSFQYCISLGAFEGGELCWLEGDQAFRVSTKNAWQKMDGRHTHWVHPYTGGDRYSLVLFCNNRLAEPIFWHSPEAQSQGDVPVARTKRTASCAKRQDLRTPPDHSCPCQRRAWIQTALTGENTLPHHCNCDAQKTPSAPLDTQRPLRVGHDFAGKDAPSHALRNLAVNCQLVFASEIDKHARQTIMDNYPPSEDMCTDITTREHAKAPPCDLYFAGWPCQSNSMAGSRLGFRNPVSRKLFDSSMAYIRAHKPRVAVLENVRGLFSVNGGADWRTVLQELRQLGCYYVDWRILNTAEHGVPQNRPRLYIVCIRDDCYRGTFKWPEPIACPSIERFLKQRDDTDASLALTQPSHRGAAEKWRLHMDKLSRQGEEPQMRPWLWCVGTSTHRSTAMYDRCPCLLRSQRDIWVSNRGRALSLRERCRLQGENPDTVHVTVSDQQWNMQLGNSMSTNVLERLLARLLPAAGLTDALPDHWESGVAQRAFDESVRND